MIPNVLSVDVEDYYHVEAFSNVVDRLRWDAYPARVVSNTQRLLDLFDELSVRATFFVLGWVAERNPGLVRDIAVRGHELGCHSYWHRLVYKLDRNEFRSDTSQAREAIEQAAGVAVRGYRAPSYSITARSLWALEVLAELGFTYDSSIFPIHHDVYGIPNAPRRPYTVNTASGQLTEIPMSTFRAPLLNYNLPVGGGGYLRILPFAYTRLGYRRARDQGVPMIVYVHPWEIDDGQPHLSGRVRSRFRHYTNLRGTLRRLRDLLALGQFTSFRESGLVPTAISTN